MLKICPSITSLLIVMCILFSFRTDAAVTVVAPTNGTCIDKTPGNFTTLSNITLIENVKSDFSTQTNRTIILTAPTGFEFNPGIGSVVWGFPTPSGNVTTASVSVTTSLITVTVSVSGTNKWDSLAVVGIQVRALSYNVSGQILRLAGAAGGTATITGDAGGAGITHGNLFSKNTGSTSSIATGNWSNPAIWSNGVVPSCGDSVFILHTVTADAAVNPEFLFIQTTGHLVANFSVTANIVFVINGNGTYTHNNTSDASTTIFKGTETFSTTSTVIILRWYSTTAPLPQNVSGNFGNVTFNQGSNWSQDGLFSPNIIKGTLTVSSGTITMDDGTNLTTSLTLQDVIINGTGALKMSTGANRNYTLITNNYTDNSTSATKSSILYQSQGNLNWTANGNVSISHNWSGYDNNGNNAGDTEILINGNLTISGGSFDINTGVNAELVLTVTGTTTISGSPTYVRFMDSNNQSLTFTTYNLYLYGGSANDFVGGNGPNCTASITITSDCLVTGASTVSTFNNNTSSTNNTTVTIGRDLIITDGELRINNTNGTYDLNVGRNMIVNGSTGKFRGQIYPSCTKNSTLNVTGYVQVNSGTFKVSEGHGNIVVSIVEDILINNGNWYGIYHLTSSNNGAATLSCTNITMNGGKYIFVNAIISDGKTVTVNVNTDVTVNFLSSTDIFAFISRKGVSNSILDLNINGNLTIGGNFPGAYFMSSSSAGNETVDIGGTLTVNAGDVFFVGDNSTLSNNHNIKTNITGNLVVTGGNIRLATGAGTDTVNVTGNVDVSGGVLTLKHSTGPSIMNITGTYTQSAGTFNIHSDTLTTTSSSTVTIQNNFTMTGGTFNFDNCAAASGLAIHYVYLNGAGYTLDGSAIITHANNYTTNFIFGRIYFTRSGTTVYSRNSSTNEIRHVKYYINSGTTVDASGSVNGFQMTSVGNNVDTTHTSLTIIGTLNMGSRILSARQYLSYYSRVWVNNGGRYRTSHPGGLYSGSSTVASSINGYVTTFNRVNYTLDANSIVEYYGTTTTTVTGIPNGAATLNAQKYGILDINFTGSAGSTWVYPETNDEVHIRTSLVLTAGEFNLDDDHITTNGGRAINLENGATMTRTNGFIRSETEDGSGLVRWNMTTNGSRIYHFGYDAATYIPFTFQQTSGSSGTVSLGTYRSANDNTPYPPTVSHVRDIAGNNNSGSTVDRFWHITVPGTSAASLTFTYASTEGTGIISPRAQQWEPVTLGWFPSAGTQSNPTATSTLAAGQSSFNTWWTLSAGASPLPISLISFNVEKTENIVEISWTTATEINNDYFTVERSDDGINFAPLKIVNGAGNSSSYNTYSILDNNPMSGRNYYRLKQTDYDGQYTYSDIESVFIGKLSSFSVYPNPAGSHSKLHLEVPQEGAYHVILTDSKGLLIYEKNMIADSGNTITVDLNDVNHKQGMYFLRVTGASDQYSQKIVIR